MEMSLYQAAGAAMAPDADESAESRRSVKAV